MNTGEQSAGMPSTSGSKTPDAEPTRTAAPIPSLGSPGSDPLPAKSNPGAALFVYGVWGLALAFALGLVAHFGHNAPYNDDFAIIPWWAGERPITLAWLWAPHNEHRIGLPKLVLVTLARISG